MKKRIKRITVILAVFTFILSVAAHAKINPNNNRATPGQPLSSADAKVVQEIYNALKTYYPMYGDIRGHVRPALWCAHKGYSDLAPENSAAAFILAGMCGASSCEADVWITKDGNLCMSHDADLSKMTSCNNGTLISKTDSSTIFAMRITKNKNAKFFHNLKMCSFKDYLQICIDYGMYPIVHLKELDYLEDDGVKKKGIGLLVSQIKEKGLESDVLITSAKAEGLELLRSMNKNIKIKALTGKKNQEEVKKIKTLEPKENYYAGGDKKWMQSSCSDYPYTAGIRSFSTERIQEGVDSYKLKEKGTLIDGATVTLNATYRVYTGDKITGLNPEVRLNGELIPPTYVTENGTEKQSYVIRYEDNINVGTAKVRIFGINRYNGEASATFQIRKASVSNGKAKIEAVPNQTYRGKDYPSKPNPTITRDGRTLVKDLDYELKYSGNDQAGSATVTITGIGNYTGTITKPFTILPMSLEDESIEASITPKVTYNGKERKPTPKVVLNGRTLLINRDFKVEYKNNKEVGKATATVIGQGNFTGKKVLTFKIE